MSSFPSEHTFPSAPTRTEQRLEFIRENADGDPPDQRLVDVLCEIARQLARLADAYEEAHK